MRWISNVLVYLSALLLTVMLLPASLVGLYYASPETFRSVVNLALDYTEPQAAQGRDHSAL